MKIQKFNEKLDIVHSSEMNDWSGHKNGNIKTGTKTLNLNIGAKVIDIFEKYGIGIEDISQKNWLEKQEILMSDEKNFIEYRVYLNKRQEWQDFIQDYEDENDIKYDELNNEEQEKIQEIYNELPYDNDNDGIEFSVFLPNSIDKSRLYEAAIADASNYLKLLYESELKNVLQGYADASDMLWNEIEGIKKFTLLKNIVITNKNIEYITTIASRLHKDSKAIYAFETLLNSKSESSDLFKEWINLIK